MKNLVLILLFVTVCFGSLLQGEMISASLKNVKPHPATNTRLMMGLKGPVKSISLSSDPTELGDLIYWFDEQGFTTRFYVEPEWGARSLSLNLIYKTEADKITEIKMVDEKDKLYGLQTFSYDAQGVLYKSTFDMYDGDVAFYDHFDNKEGLVIDYGVKKEMLWDASGNMILFTCYGEDNSFSISYKCTYNSAGHLIRVEGLDCNGKLMGYTTCRCDKNGYLLIASHFDSKDRTIGYKAYTRDQNGNPVTISQFDDENKPILVDSFQYEYDEYGNCTHSENDWGISDNVYTYYPRGSGKD